MDRQAHSDLKREAKPLTSQLMQRVGAGLKLRLPERHLFIKSDEQTRFVRLETKTQLIAWVGSGVFVAWTTVVTAVFLMDSIGSGNYRDQASRERMTYDSRFSALEAERDIRAAEVVGAQEAFAVALNQISAMQSELLASEERRRELETGLELAQRTLTKVESEREGTVQQVATLEGATGLGERVNTEQLASTLEFTTAALADTAGERDQLALEVQEAADLVSELDLELRLVEERNDDIFRQLEDAMAISVEPLDDMFRTAGLDPEELIAEVREGYSGQSGSLTQIQFSTMGSIATDDGTFRANRILDQLEELNLYRMAVDRVPLSMPVLDSFRYTSPFGPRWGRMHEGVDMAGPVGTPIYATADGVVTFAGWQTGYGRIIKVQHEFGIETRYPHLNAIQVEVGQRVSRGERIGDMGNSGRSTGSHLHYEIRVNGDAIDPMIYIRAGQEVL